MAQMLYEAAEKDRTPATRQIESHWCAGSLSFRLHFPEDKRTTPPPASGLVDEPLLIAGLVDIIRQIGELASGDETDEYGVLQPTHEALQRTLTVLSDAFAARLKLYSSTGENLPARSILPRGSVTTDEQGGLRIEWKGHGCAVRLVVGATKQGRCYVYHEVGKKYGTEQVTGSILASWLKLID